MRLSGRVIFEVIDQGTGDVVSRDELLTLGIKRPETIDQIGLETTLQEKLVQSMGDKVIELQGPLVNTHTVCPKCQHKVVKKGKTRCEIHTLNTDHMIEIQKYRCPQCDWTSSDSIRNMYGTDVHTTLTKIQAELGSNFSHRKAARVLDLLSFEKERPINNKQRIKRVLDKVGELIGVYNMANVPEKETGEPELIIHVDGAYVATQEEEKRSFEAMIATIYRPEDVQQVNENENIIQHKTCVASAKEDHQASMKAMVLNAAKRVGMTKKTTVTAFSDGASNCKSIIEALSGHCGQLHKILDWFHIAMKFQNILPVVPKDLQEEFKRAKWTLWHGRKEECCEKLKRIIDKVDDEKSRKRVAQLEQYLTNNFDLLVNYEERKNNQQPFTSHVAESTVENLVNSRCRQTGKMKWLREGTHSLLQIRCATYSNFFNQLWNSIVPNLYQPI